MMYRNVTLRLTFIKPLEIEFPFLLTKIAMHYLKIDFENLYIVSLQS